MSGTGNNPQIPQGSLNRIRTHIVLPSYPTLNATSSNMGKSFARFDFEGPFVHQIETATGVVNSPEPYVMARVHLHILRTQSLASSYLSQLQTNAVVGDVVGHSDTTAFPKITLSNCSVTEIDPGAYDGTDPTVSITFRGVFYTNNNLWQAL